GIYACGAGVIPTPPTHVSAGGQQTPSVWFAVFGPPISRLQPRGGSTHSDSHVLVVGEWQCGTNPGNRRCVSVNRWGFGERASPAMLLGCRDEWGRQRPFFIG